MNSTSHVIITYTYFHENITFNSYYDYICVEASKERIFLNLAMSTTGYSAIALLVMGLV
ncbi:hypothetical protein [Nostoc sphaeroides]|uniref:hypothetical protein n=1 Tax=Nostoc sphaeroides TaxID=446679 RepID=UPI001884443F|nr:hypothetical protein [Nostoc sphaeroides]